MASEKPTLTNRKCSTPGCGKNLTVRGFCVACYYRNLRHGAIKKGDQTTRFRHRLSNIDTVNRTADCIICGTVKIFHRGGGQYRCAVASNEKGKLYKRAYRASKKALMEEACEICGNPENLCYDHCHTSGEYRGTLCARCNLALGLVDDNVAVLKRAISYLNDFYKK